MASPLNNLIHHINGGHMTEAMEGPVAPAAEDANTGAPAGEPPAATEPPAAEGSVYLILEGKNEQEEGVRAVGQVRALSPDAAIEAFAQDTQVDEGVHLRAMALRNWPKTAKRIAYERRVALH